ncbi:hypothetical protein ACKI2N_031970 [Cupriavidus sp. 30B13]|uniref:hypothetical protein n=1 Tax=Cupriavidus sp. 30B13 TaxID=3384241 RepID=UPI003B915DCF
MDAAPGLGEGLMRVGNAYLDGRIDLSGALKMGAEQVRSSWTTAHPKQALLDTATEVSAWGVSRGGIVGDAALYGGSVVGGVADGLLPNSKAEALIGAGLAPIGGPLMGKAVSGLNSLAARSVFTSFLAEDAGVVASRIGSATGQVFAEGFEGLASRYPPAFGRMGILPDNATSSAVDAGAFPQSLRMNPRDVRFTQDTVSPNFSDRGTISDTINQLRNGQISAEDFPAIRTVNYGGNVWTLDNRRLAVFSAAQVDDIPVRMLNLSDPAVNAEFLKKFNPINDGKNVVVVPSAGRAAARAVLRDYGMYGPN